ncbi:hypothetical protein M153_2500050723 [Pseudoloma neurophilia]|uniref:Uncharacterized protein n=1 Tax=Pseudoloma neurophilia TaxID=146866 RepID=A0A0R0M0V2_9MICR|nr:hypothetical protein M153_2500050723 [Pseudoloma neurophilia]
MFCLPDDVIDYYKNNLWSNPSEISCHRIRTMYSGNKVLMVMNREAVGGIKGH